MTKSKGIIVSTNYNIINDTPVVSVFGRLEDGKSFSSKYEFLPYFYICKKDFDKAQKIIKFEYEEVSLKTFKEEEVVKVILKVPKEVPVLRKLFEGQSIPCYESDIPFTRRFLIDRGLQASIEISGDFEKGEKVDLEIKNSTLKGIKHDDIKNNLEILSIDIETDKDAQELYAISFYGKTVSKVFVVKNSAFEKVKIKDCYVFDDEEALLKDFYKEIEEIDPDIITGWNFIDFDLKVIANISKKYDLNFNIGRDEKDSSLRIESSFLKDSKAHVNGRMVLDGIALMKSSFIKLDNYKLNTAAETLLGESKVSTADDRTEFIENSYRKNPKLFFEYSLKDSVLVYDILMKTKVFDLTVQRSLLSGMHMDSVSASIASFDSVYLPELHKKGFVANSVYRSDGDQGLGGFVMSCKPGIYDNVLVLDFKSLYPSLIRTFNIDPKEFVSHFDKFEYKVGEDRSGLKGSDENLDTSKFVVSPNGSVFNKGYGLLPSLIGEFWKARDVARANKNELARNAIKLMMNSMYGVLASSKSRYFNRDVSNSITGFAQFFIQLTIKTVEDMGYDVIYGDTDSLFVDTGLKDSSKAVAIGKKIEKDMNLFLKKYIKEIYDCESQLDLEFEKTFVRFFIPAKKRYAGLRLLEDGSTKLEFTGLEFVRRDWTGLAKEFQMKLLDLIFADKPIVGFISKFIKDLEDGKYDSLLVYKKSLSKPIESYVKTTPPHVKAAKLLDKIESRVIEYYMTLEGPQPLQKVTSKIDYQHYIEKQIKSIANGVLHVMGKDFDDLMKGHKQVGLGSFL